MILFVGLFFTIVLPILWGGLLASPFHRFSGKSGWLAAGAVTGIPLYGAVTFFFANYFGKISYLGIILSHIVFFLIVFLIRRVFPQLPEKRWALEGSIPKDLDRLPKESAWIHFPLILGSIGIVFSIFTLLHWFLLRFYEKNFMRDLPPLFLVWISCVFLGIFLYFTKHGFPFWSKILDQKESNPKKEKIEKIISISVVFLLCVLMVLCMRQVIHLRPGGYFIGFMKNFGDLGLHIHYISSFVFSDNFPPQNPIFSGIPLRYPFISDYYSALVWVATNNMEAGLEVPGMFLGLAFIIILYQWTWHLTGSRLAGALAPLLFLLLGSMGWFHWFGDLWRGEANWANLLPRHGGYGMIPKQNYQWPNVLHALWMTQRGFQFAFPMVIFLLAIVLDAAKMEDKRKFLFVALLAGILPIIHGHSILILFLCGLVLMIFYPSRKWLYLLIPLALFWFPQVLYLAGKIGPKVIRSQSFIRWGEGWLLDSFSLKVFLIFWLKNSGLLIPLTFLFLFLLPKEKKDFLIFSWLGMAMFFLGNLVIFAPWNWDNTKILIFWPLLSAPFLAYGFSRAFQSKKIWPIPLAVLCFWMLIWTGVLDLTHALRMESDRKSGENHRIFSAENQENDIEIAKWIRENTPKDAIFLAAPEYNHPLALTGRTLFLGWGGHLWSHGLNAGSRNNDLKIMVSGEGDFKALYRKYGITHVIYGPRERDPQFKFNREFLAKNIGQRHAAYGFILYEVPEDILRGRPEGS